MPNITLSIRDNDNSLWDYARRYADAHYTSLSGLATMAVAQYLSKQPDSEVAEIIVVARVDGQPQRVRFTGRWLAEPETTDMDDADADVRLKYHRAGVAVTAKGRIAVYYQDTDGQAHLAHFDSITEARRVVKVPVSDAEWSQAKQAMQPPVTLDI